MFHLRRLHHVNATWHPEPSGPNTCATSSPSRASSATMSPAKILKMGMKKPAAAAVPGVKNTSPSTTLALSSSNWATEPNNEEATQSPHSDCEVVDGDEGDTRTITRCQRYPELVYLIGSYLENFNSHRNSMMYQKAAHVHYVV
jgi:hypothetical protein